MALLSLMGTLPHVSAPRNVAALLALVAAAAACGGGSPTIVAIHSPSPASSPSTSAQASPSANATASTQPVTGSYGVLATRPGNTSGQYTVSVVGIDGKVTGSKTINSPANVSCANAAAAVVPIPVSTSNTGVYYEEASGGVTFMSPNGQVRQSASVPAGTASRRSMFAVSPDDQRIAVVVADFNSSGASTRLYVENLDGTNHLDLFSESGAYTLWPIGWHGTNNLVVAKVPSCTQGGGPFCCGPLELHVVDPATGTRRFILGGSGCVVAGPASIAGVACETSDFTQVREINWTAGAFNSFPIQGPAPAYLSPDGQLALVASGGTTVIPAIALSMDACLWIDNSHLLAGGDAQNQARIGEVPGGKILPVAAQGECAGRIPGGL
ncbi:MAG: hypothetical protein E6I61_04315 [Chloroflexi bacterium]|nr:MAG: hypothetical protein E6I71_05550 [Chloroflexota bacterium]TME42053.1 MAG: hypothetical protein E6I61_04315 [Chloroflexota bacterium]TME49861.1 MAG: hypothetical protein E6I53_14575 [Chloroflexota bacterium]